MLERVKIDNADELFLAALASALRLENTVEKMLGTLSEEAQSTELTQRLRHHREETQAQIRNLQQVFQALGKEPDESPCLPIEGIEKQGQVLLKLADHEQEQHTLGEVLKTTLAHAQREAAASR
jgi:ferritin-like metal-binding protein YciE